jgi:hypothetical protein
VNVVKAGMFAVCACCALGACVSRSISLDSVRPAPPYDSSRKSVTDISSGVVGWVSLPHRDLIRVDFTSGTDLRNMVALGGNILFMHTYFCDREDKNGGLGTPGVYVDLADARKERLVHEFIFFIDVSRKAGPDSVLLEPEFDLSAKAEDICFYVTVDGATPTYQSKVGKIPKAVIENVFIGREAR